MVERRGFRVKTTTRFCFTLIYELKGAFQNLNKLLHYDISNSPRMRIEQSFNYDE